MNKKNKPHTRPNAKPRLPDAKRVNLFLDESTTENAKQIGDGNLSLGVRIAVKEFVKKQKTIDEKTYLDGGDNTEAFGIDANEVPIFKKAHPLGWDLKKIRWLK